MRGIRIWFCTQVLAEVWFPIAGVAPNLGSQASRQFPGGWSEGSPFRYFLGSWFHAVNTCAGFIPAQRIRGVLWASQFSEKSSSSWLKLGPRGA